MKKKKNRAMIAKRPFRIKCNEIDIKIEKGDDLELLSLDEKFIKNLITEKVIEEQK